MTCYTATNYLSVKKLLFKFVRQKFVIVDMLRRTYVNIKEAQLRNKLDFIEPHLKTQSTRVRVQSHQHDSDKTN